MEPKKKKILVIRLSAMGDVIFTIPLANCLKDNGYEVHWLVSEKGYSFVKNNPCVDKVFLAPVEKWKKSKKPFQNFIEYLKILKELRREKYDIALDTQLILKSLYWTKFCGAKRRIVARNAREGAILGGNEIIPSTRDGFKRHAVKCYLKYAEYLGLNTENIKVTLPETSSETKQKIDGLLSELDNNKKTIVLSPATTWFSKHWNKDNWKKLVLKLGDKYNLVFTGMDSDKELIEYIGGNNHINLVGKTNLEDLQELFSRADLMLSLDSGSTHLAWAVQKMKIITIFCCTPSTLYAPLGDETKYIALSGNESCQPCHRKKCPNKTNKNICTFSPKVDEVLCAIEKLIS